MLYLWHTHKKYQTYPSNFTSHRIKQAVTQEANLKGRDSEKGISLRPTIIFTFPPACTVSDELHAGPSFALHNKCTLEQVCFLPALHTLACAGRDQRGMLNFQLSLCAHLFCMEQLGGILACAQ